MSDNIAMLIDKPIQSQTMFMNRRIFELTVDEFVSILNANLPAITNVVSTEPTNEKRYIYSIKGLAEFLSCSVPTAQKMKNLNLIPYSQIGRKVMFEEGEVLKAMRSKGGRK